MNRRARVQFAVQRLARTLAPPTQCGHDFINGTITSVTAGASVDGVAQLVVTVNGTDTLAPYLASYTSPTVGDLVRVEFDNGSPLIHGRVIGLPTF